MIIDAGPGPIEIIVLLALAAVAFVAVRAVWFPARRRNAVSAPSCGRCGYNTTGLASLTCPECGGDLRAVGILTAATSTGRVTFPVAGALFTAFWLFTGVLLARVAERVVPKPKRYTVAASLDQPGSGAYGGVDVYAAGTAWGGERPPMSVVISLRPKAGSPPRGVGPMKLDPETGSYAYLDTTPKQISAESGFNGEAVAKWLAAAGLDASDPRLRSEANRIAAAARHAGRRPVTVADLSGSRRSSGNDPHFGTITHSAGYASNRLTWLPVPLLAFYTIAWAVGLRYLWRMTRAPATHA